MGRFSEVAFGFLFPGDSVRDRAACAVQDRTVGVRSSRKDQEYMYVLGQDTGRSTKYVVLVVNGAGVGRIC